MNGKKVTIVIPIYNEEANIPSLFPRLMPVMEALNRPYEVLLIDDGSRDKSVELLLGESKKYPGKIRILELSRNFGQHPAILAGFRQITGDYIITLDADLQNPPEEIPNLLAKLEQGYDVVGGIRQKRQDTLFRKGASKIVNWMTNRITGMQLHDYGCMLRGYSREVVDQINQCEENSTFIPALGLLFSRKPIEIPVAHAAREAGRTKYSFYRLIRLNFDLMTGFSVIPLQMISLAGFIVAGCGFIFGVYLFIRRFIILQASEAEGVFTLFALAFLVMGALMASLGIVGEYIGRIYSEVRGRPRFVVRKVHETKS